MLALAACSFIACVGSEKYFLTACVAFQYRCTQMSGRIPFRYPVPLNDPRFPSGVPVDWQSYMPFENNPWTLNPSMRSTNSLFVCLSVHCDYCWCYMRSFLVWFDCENDGVRQVANRIGATTRLSYFESNIAPTHSLRQRRAAKRLHSRHCRIATRCGCGMSLRVCVVCVQAPASLLQRTIKGYLRKQCTDY